MREIEAYLVIVYMGNYTHDHPKGSTYKTPTLNGLKYPG